MNNDIGQSTAWVALWDNRLEGKLNQYSAMMRKDISLTKYGCTNGVNEKEGVSVVVEREDERDEKKKFEVMSLSSYIS